MSHPAEVNVTFSTNEEDNKGFTIVNLEDEDKNEKKPLRSQPRMKSTELQMLAN